MKKHLIYFLIIFITTTLAQESKTDSLISNFLNQTKFISHIDVVYSYDFNTNQKPQANERKLAGSALFNNEFRLNFFSFEMQHTNNDFRFAGGLKFGDIPHLLSSPDKQSIRTIKKAYFGVKLGKSSWLDFGYMGQPFGFEGTGVDNWLTQVSIANYCQPGNILGIKYSTDLSSSLNFYLSVHNSYNLISANNTNKSVGVGINYHPTNNFYINFASELGDEGENKSKSFFHSFNDLIMSWDISDVFSIIAQGDFAIQTNSKKSDPDKPAIFYSGVLATRISLSDKFKLTFMGDYVKDEDGFITNGVANTNNTLEVASVTAGIQFYPIKNASLKLEYQYTNADQNIFYYKSKIRNNITFSTSIKLSN